MNDEIKEILDYLKDEKWDYYRSDLIPYKVLVMGERDILLDYITNLQKTNKNHSKKLIELGNKITNLQQENERLKEQVNKNKVIVEYTIKPSFTTRKLEDYKSRCEKAIEYITSEEYYDLNNKKTDSFSEDSKNYFIAHDNLLNILQNGSDDNE